jgi:SOS-response transcriptional repressor LexA
MTETATATATERPQLTDRQREVFEFIADFRDRNGYCVAIDDIATHFGIHKNAVVNHVWSLRRKGYVCWQPGQARTLRPVGVANG